MPSTERYALVHYFLHSLQSLLPHSAPSDVLLARSTLNRLGIRSWLWSDLPTHTPSVSPPSHTPPLCISLSIHFNRSCSTFRDASSVELSLSLMIQSGDDFVGLTQIIPGRFQLSTEQITRGPQHLFLLGHSEAKPRVINQIVFHRSNTEHCSCNQYSHLLQSSKSCAPWMRSPGWLSDEFGGYHQTHRARTGEKNASY